jgi:hypothetical protein
MVLFLQPSRSQADLDKPLRYKSYDKKPILHHYGENLEGARLPQKVASRVLFLGKLLQNLSQLGLFFKIKAKVCFGKVL